MKSGPAAENVLIRGYRPSDQEALRRLTVASFAGVTLEQNVEETLGVLNGHDWRWGKARHIEEDVAAIPAGVFVAESGGRVIGYVMALVDRATGKGRIPNLAVESTF